MKISMNTVRVLVVGDEKVGKSAVTVRFLTRRFIGEYNSNIDLLYKSSFKQEDGLANVEILDSCTKKNTVPAPSDNQVSWADSFVIIYSICNRASFNRAKILLDQIQKSKSPTYFPALLLGNKTDLEHRRQISIAEGHEVAMEYSCQYYEVSAADNYISVSIAFQSLLREAKTVLQQKSTLTKRRKNSFTYVSRKLGAMFGKSSNKDSETDKRRPSLSSSHEMSPR